MCFSERVSWTTLGVCWAGCAALAATGAPHWQALAALFAVVGGMQLVEALLWRNPQRCDAVNAAVSSAGAVINHAEPLVLWWLCAQWLRPRRLEGVTRALALAYAAVFGVYALRFIARPARDKCTYLGPAGLVWRWNEPPGVAYALFMALLVSTCLAYMPPGLDVAATAAVLLTYAASFAKYRDAKMIGSMWCFYAAFLPWLGVAASSVW